MGEVIDENGLAKHIRYRHRIITANWSSDTKLWTIEAVDRDSGEAPGFHRQLPLDVPGLLSPFRRLHAGMEGDGKLQGRASSIRSAGRKTSTREGKRIVVIGSGATAATLIPNIAGQCEHVTMLQR